MPFARQISLHVSTISLTSISSHSYYHTTQPPNQPNNPPTSSEVYHIELNTWAGSLVEWQPGISISFLQAWLVGSIWFIWFNSTRSKREIEMLQRSPSNGNFLGCRGLGEESSTKDSTQIVHGQRNLS